MKVTGTIKMIETVGRTDRFVKKQLEKDYFLALEITNIDGAPISCVADAFAVLQPRFPSIKVGDVEMSNVFEAYKLAAGMTDACHLSLAYFGDFRIDRSTDNEMDLRKVDAAMDELHGKPMTFDIDGCPFQVVSTSTESSKIKTDADLAAAPAVGGGRDTILNLLPNRATQELFARTLTTVFGEGFQLWNAQKRSVPFHITIAQTDKLNAAIALVRDTAEEHTETAALSM